MNDNISKNAIKTRDNWGSRMGYILSTVGMAVGLGAMWRFPMVVAQNGGGAFVLAFFIICVCVIPAGFGEIGLGRFTRQGAVGAFEQMVGKKGRPFGYFMASISLALNMYYVIVIGYVMAYIFFTLTGSPFLEDPQGFYNALAGNKPLTYTLAVIIIAITAMTVTGGIKNGIELICKIMLPSLFVILLIITIRVVTLPGIAEGIEYYVKPDFSQWTKPSLWVSAAGMALFAIGLGPGYLLTYGSYLSGKADIATDFVTVNVLQLLACVLAGFATIPAVVLFNLDHQSGTGLVFMVLPKVFQHIPGGQIWMFCFLVALFFAGLSSAIAIMEVPVTTITDALGWGRKKTVLIVACTVALGTIPCVWSERFFTILDFLVANVLYVVVACGLAFYLSWVYGARRVREEWINPTSVFKYGVWTDILYKFVAVPALIYFSITSTIEFFKLLF